MNLDQVTTAPPATSGTTRRDAGVTFVETVLTVVLLGVVVVPVLAAVRSAVRTSAVAESAAQVETVLIDATDRVHRALDSCDFTGDATAAAETIGWPTASVTVRHEYLDETGQWATGSVPTLPACPDGNNRLGLAKRITITVTDPDGSVSRTIQMVKSDV
jgi:hypothetical protein